MKTTDNEKKKQLTQLKQNKLLRELSDEDLKQVTGGDIERCNEVSTHMKPRQR